MADKFPIAALFSRPTTWRVLSILLTPPFTAHQQHAIAEALGMPDASVQRGLRPLLASGVAIKKRKQYAANPGHIATRYLWLVRQVERELALPVEVRNALSTITEAERFRDAVVVLFGSWAQSSGVMSESDIDVAAFSDSLTRGTHRSFSGRYTIDLHTFSGADLFSVKNSAALDAVLNGIPLRDRERVFDAVTEIRTFPKSFLLYRLEQADAQLLRSVFLADSGQHDAAVFFRDLARRTALQLRTILDQGQTQSWRRSTSQDPVETVLEDVRERLAREGSQVWLT